jgi:hypothetical protein
LGHRLLRAGLKTLYQWREERGRGKSREREEGAGGDKEWMLEKRRCQRWKRKKAPGIRGTEEKEN